MYRMWQSTRPLTQGLGTETLRVGRVIALVWVKGLVSELDTSGQWRDRGE